MTPYAFLVADNTPSVTFTFAVFVPALHVHAFPWQLSFLFQVYLATVPINMVTYMWNTDRKAVIIRIIDALAVVKSMTGLPYRHLQKVLIGTLGDSDAPCSVRNRQCFDLDPSFWYHFLHTFPHDSIPHLFFPSNLRTNSLGVRSQCGVNYILVVIYKRFC